MSTPNQPPGPPPEDPKTQDPTQQGQQPEDHELVEYLIAEENHSQSSAEQELRRNRESVKQRHKQHKARHGGHGGR